MSGENKSNKKSNKIIPGLLSFVIPVFIVTLSYFQLGIYPGGKNMVLTYDLRAQLLPLYGYLSNSGGPGYDNLFYSMSGGLGGGFFGTLALYISPFDFIYCFVPLKYLPDAIYFMILTKIGLCGLCMSLFLGKNGKFSLNNVLIVTFSCCYALMSYNLTYSMSPMWYDAIMCMPLLALSMERIFLGKKSPVFTLIMAFCIISDYYMAYMVAISLVIYSIFRLIEDNNDIKTFVKRFSAFAIHGLISAGMSLFVIIPVYLDFKRGKFSEGDIASDGSFIKNSLFDVFNSFLSQSYSGFEYDASPNVFCGSLIVLLVLSWFYIGIREKKGRNSIVTAILIILLYFLSFIFGPLDRIWHGFRDPVCFSCRYAFTFVFFMICFAARGTQFIKGLNYKISIKLLKVIYSVAILFTFIELYINCSYIISRIGTDSGYTLSEEYYKYCDAYENLIPYEELSESDGYGRIISNTKFSNNDNALFGYNGFARFSSSYNYNISEFFRALGVGCCYHTFKEEGITPPVAGLVYTKYYISFVKELDWTCKIDDYNGYSFYKNNMCLPFAFEITGDKNESHMRQDEPFDNINNLYNDLLKFDDSKSNIFERELIEKLDSIDALTDSNVIIANYEFTTTRNGHYYIFVEYSSDPEIRNNNDENPYEISRREKIRQCYVDGNIIGNYGNDQYSVCLDLGVMEEGENHILTLKSSAKSIGEVLLFYFNDELYKQIVSSVSGYSISKIDNNGIVLTGNSSTDVELFVSLPFEDGYNIYVDGIKTTYGSYCDSFITIPVSEGDHNILIKYNPRGLYLGCILSVIGMALFIVYNCSCLKDESDN